jgi:serine/threonine protein kinase
VSRTPAGDAGPPDLPGYQFIKHIGAGGNAQVYLYEQDLPHRKVAVKVLNESALSEAARRRFTAEANVTAGLAHRHIVQVFDANVTKDGRPYLVMPYYPQPNLSVRARRSHFSVADVLRIGIQIGSAVETSHRHDVLHRDIKPQNILTDSYGEPALTDFGIATTTAGDGPEGLSVPWSPPEILYGTGPGDQRADVYSLGATLWHLLAGRSPFELPGGDNSALALMGRIKSDPPPRTQRADVPGSLDRLLRQAMAKDPAARPQSAMELIRGLQSVEQELRLPLTHPILPADESPGDTRDGDTVIRMRADGHTLTGRGMTGRGMSGGGMTGAAMAGWNQGPAPRPATAPGGSTGASWESPAGYTGDRVQAGRPQSASPQAGDTWSGNPRDGSAQSGGTQDGTWSGSPRDPSAQGGGAWSGSPGGSSAQSGGAQSGGAQSGGAQVGSTWSGGTQGARALAGGTQAGQPPWGQPAAPPWGQPAASPWSADAGPLTPAAPSAWSATPDAIVTGDGRPGGMEDGPTRTRGSLRFDPWGPPAPPDGDQTRTRGPLRLDPQGGQPGAGAPRSREFRTDRGAETTMARPARVRLLPPAGATAGAARHQAGHGPRLSARVLAVGGGVLAVAVAAVVFFTLGPGHGQPRTAPSNTAQAQTSGTGQNALGPGATAPGQPAVTARSAGGSEVSFSWTYANPATGDTFRWQRVSGTAGGPGGTVTGPKVVISLSAGHSLCIVVQVRRAGGQASDPSEPACWPS